VNIAEITTYKEGGAYTHVAELARRIKADILIVCGNTKKVGYQQEDYTFFHIPRLMSVCDIFFINKLGSYKKFKEVLKKHKIDLVHFHSPLFTFPIGLLREKNYPLIMTTHYLLDVKANKLAASVYHKFIKWMTKFIAKNVDKIICVNEDYISVFLSWGIERDKLIYIPNGVDIKKFSPGESNAKMKSRDDKLIVYFGRLHYQKNVDILIRSFKYVKDKVDDVKLVIIGDGIDFDKLKRMSSHDKDIIMTGFLPDENLIDYLRSADLVVFPSRGENASFTLLETMACGIPAISSDVGNAKNLLANGRGILLEKYTEEEIAEKCIFLLKNKEIAEKIGAKSRKFVQQNYNWEKISKETEELYKTVIEQRKEKW
jgi:glycosyltransferase involved in cell wall biosynthesis